MPVGLPSPLPPRRALLLALALFAALAGVAASALLPREARLPYADTQLAAARRMERAMAAVLAHAEESGIPLPPEDLNETGLIGPEWTALSTSLGSVEAKRTALQPDFAALMVRYYKEAGLMPGDAVACAFSGSFPGLALAAVAAADEMGLDARVIASYGASTFGATRPELTVVDMLGLARQAGVLQFELLAVSPGGDRDQGGGNPLFPGEKELAARLSREDGAPLLDEPGLGENIARRLSLYGPDVKCFVNAGGSSASLGLLAAGAAFPNGLVTSPPAVPGGGERGLLFEYAARGVPVVHLLNIRGLALRHGLPVDPVPLPAPGNSPVYSGRGGVPAAVPIALAVSLALLAAAGWDGRRKNNRRE